MITCHVAQVVGVPGIAVAVARPDAEVVAVAGRAIGLVLVVAERRPGPVPCGVPMTARSSGVVLGAAVS